ncbi:hypothetical protein HY636_03805 [Candidatus Woesearchaeota archaeon]|nr:hypothetical protein [Candidatus Woesearchaeota archaeon]
MVSITLSVPEDVKELMNRFDEVNWSGFVRKCILEKTKQLTWKEEMLKKLETQKEMIDWSVELARKAGKGRLNELRKKGFL